MLHALEKSILATRWLLALFLLGLGAALALYAVRFVWKLAKLAGQLFEPDDSVFLLGVLHLLDAALVASLIVMVAISSWDSLVSKLADENGATKVAWAGKIDAGNLKIKLATAIIAISSIHLLQIFMRVNSYGDREVTWALALHGMFLTGGLVLAAMDRLEAKPGKG
ncbi:MAG: YqhA family protein [Pseudomonadota bacterium]